MFPARAFSPLIWTFMHAERWPQHKWKIVRYSINIVKPYIVSASPHMYLYFHTSQTVKTVKTYER